MPVSIPEQDPHVNVLIVFDKSVYLPHEVIGLQVQVTGPGTEQRPVTFSGSLTALATPITWQASTQVAPHITYGPVTGPEGYDVVQDPGDPSRYTATPIMGGGGDGPTDVAG